MLSSNLIERLEHTHPILSHIFQTHSDTRLKSFAENLFAYASKTIEAELLQSFAEEWADMKMPPADIERGLNQLQAQPVLQTSHHITPTNGPTFLAYDLISCAGLKADQIYLVGANSGVAFSNPAWSGALSFGNVSMEELLNPDHADYHQALRSAAERKNHGVPENRISLIPASQRDQLVYGSTINSAMLKRYDRLSKRVHEFLPKPNHGELFSYWAAKSCSVIQKKILNQKHLFIFDINRTIKRYLVFILSRNGDHPIKQLLFNKSVREHVEKVFQKPVLFLSSYKGKKSYKVDRLIWETEGLISRKSGLVASSSEELVEGLENDRLCPGIFLTFFVLRFINGIRCLGSFNQLEYIEDFRNKWRLLPLGGSLNLKADHHSSLTTGRLETDGQALWPLDLLIKNDSISVKNYTDMKMGRLWEPILKQLTAK